LGIAALEVGGSGQTTRVQDAAFDAVLDARGITPSRTLITEAHAECSTLAAREPTVPSPGTDPAAHARVTAADSAAVTVYCPSEMSALLALLNRN
jgi:hypothetical protein